MSIGDSTATQRLNETFIQILEEFSDLMSKKGEPMRALAYKKGAERLMMYPTDIITVDQLKTSPIELTVGLGKKILEKLEEYMTTGTIVALEKERANPMVVLTNVYGIGPAKAKDLIGNGITTIEQLRSNGQCNLNETQLQGVKYYDDILKRIPREEIEVYKTLLATIFESVTSTGSRFEIVGSYRRGAATSGDIDIIVTNDDNIKKNFSDFTQALHDKGLIKVFLTEGKTKCLTVMQLPGENQLARRVDFMYAPRVEYAFAVLYFTGSKYFNVAMREHAVKMGFTLNEHGFCIQENKVKGERVKGEFQTERSIFKFIGMKYIEAVDRKGVRFIQLEDPVPTPNQEPIQEPIQEPNPVKDPMPIQEPVVGMYNLKRRKTLKRKSTPSPDKLIKDFQVKGISILKSIQHSDLEKMLTLADSVYHDNQTPLMTDSEYDILKDFLAQISPGNAAVISVGTSVKKNKVTLPYDMPSMDKIKPDTGALEKWKSTYNGPYVISGKADGVSGLYSTENGEKRLYTRGNGKEGGDISHIIPFLNLPDIKNITIRGEFMIEKKVFNAKYKKIYANPRNLVAGIINREKKIDHSIYADVHFVAYEVITPQIKPSDQMSYLQRIGVDTILFKTMDLISNETLSELLIDWRESFKYELDGIIVSNDKIYTRESGNPEHSFAFKMVLSEQVAEAKVVDVLWAPSRHGYLKPRIQIEPVVLGGTTITYATAFNADFVEKNKLGIGAIVQLVRSGDVIPHILAVVSPATISKMPDIPYVWNESHVDVMVIDPNDDKTVQLQCIVFFFKELKVDLLGEGNVARIVDAGYNTISKVLHMTMDDFIKVDGFKDKSATKVFESIKDKITNASLVDIIAAANVFGRGIGKRRVQPIIDSFPHIITSSDSSGEKIKLVESVAGMASKTATLFVKHIPTLLQFLEETKLLHKLVLPKKVHVEQNTTNPFYGKNVVMTGSREKAIVSYLLNNGAKIVSGVNGKTYLIIKKDDNYSSSSVTNGESKNITITTVDAFITDFINK